MYRTTAFDNIASSRSGVPVHSNMIFDPRALAQLPEDVFEQGARNHPSGMNSCVNSLDLDDGTMVIIPLVQIGEPIDWDEEVVFYRGPSTPCMICGLPVLGKNGDQWVWGSNPARYGHERCYRPVNRLAHRRWFWRKG